MDSIFSIFGEIILPLFLLLGCGVLLDRFRPPDLRTLSDLNFYVFVPALAFISLLESDLSGSLATMLLGFNAIHLLLLFAICWVVFSRKSSRADRGILTASVLFSNCGNFGIPFALMAFGPTGVQVIALILVFQNLAAFTLGIWLMGSEQATWKARLLGPLKAPVLWAVGAAFLLNALEIRPPAALQFPLTQLAKGLVPVALLTLGVQLSRATWAAPLGPTSTVAVMRLIVAPLLVFALIPLWQIMAPETDPLIVAVLICSAALPVGVNVSILALQYKRRPELASQFIFWTTLISSLTLTFWLLATRTPSLA